MNGNTRLLHRIAWAVGCTGTVLYSYKILDYKQIRIDIHFDKSNTNFDYRV